MKIFEGSGQMHKIDEIDKRILNELSKNCRRSLRQISRKLEISITTLSSRIEKLEKLGVIENYSAILNPEILGYDITAIIEITVLKGKLLEVENEVAKNKNVFAVYDVTGTSDAMVIARFKKRADLNAFIKSLLAIEHVDRTNTHLVLNIVKTDHRVFL
jgi:DNA-binding Lrp family transcriptional regulator